MAEREREREREREKEKDRERERERKQSHTNGSEQKSGTENVVVVTKKILTSVSLC